MKLRTYTNEIAVTAILVILLVVALNPTDLLMPTSVNAMLIIGFILAFFVFLALLWKETAKDERDNLHILSAGRVSFFVGTSLLTTGIVYQMLMHSIDLWLVITLISMITAKIVTRVFIDLRM
ncbi:hypothetical protein CO179_03185 [candidate division WWE3 bacterium CG_4_9_14_3_um_filter_39_7]|uniref:Uncharacterized protein n=1 Tax=candidate division WWE3 bacterium CG_4_9_14_3_um_filter_39_7 TaxID=1975080 RepID=A0A2M7X2B6_UNCKA|nr:MAG: hypothetical protein CO179_03185 [candidate division WWE3 bacterium CG_4_9_14_3_um_filter_39_7]